jgi:hypothetical protein
VTIAVCFRCGNLKFGAFCPCPDCSALPQNEDELVLSLAMTDHYFDRPTLERMGAAVKEGKPPHLSSETRENMLADLRRSGLVEQLRRMWEQKSGNNPIPPPESPS